MALLDSLMGMQNNQDMGSNASWLAPNNSSMMGMAQNPFIQYRQMQANPFTRMLPGSEYFNQTGSDYLNSFGSRGQNPDDFNQVSTDFAGTAPGLPNLPDNLMGFGFGQTAPEMNVNDSLRQTLIKSLVDQMMNGSIGLSSGGYTDNGF